MLVAARLQVQPRREGRHGALRAQVAEDNGRLVRDDARRALGRRRLELQLHRHVLDLGVLLLEQRDHRIDRGRAQPHEGEAALLEDPRAPARHEQALRERRDRLRVAHLGEAERRLLVQQEVLLVGRRREDLHERRHGALVADLDEREQRGDARAVGARLDGQGLFDRLDERIDGVGGLHVGEHARHAAIVDCDRSRRRCSRAPRS